MEVPRRGWSTARVPKIPWCNFGNMIAPALMGHVAIPYNWKEFVFHRGCSFNINSSFETGLIVGGGESKEERQTIIFTPLNPFGDNPDEEAPGVDLSVPRKVYYHTNWKHTEDAVHWIKLSRAQHSESVSSGILKQMRDTTSSLEERPKFEIDLRSREYLEMPILQSKNR